MYSFGKTSLERYNTLHVDLQLILSELIHFYDVSILEGLRTVERQQALYAEGKSKLDGITKKSKHQGIFELDENGNVISDYVDENGNIVSLAVDIMPYKKGTNAFSGMMKDKMRFYFMMGMVKAIAKKLLLEGKITHEIRFGLDWDSDDVFSDQTFDDLPHMELVIK